MTAPADMTDAELNDALAVEVMGWERRGGFWCASAKQGRRLCWSPTTDPRDCASLVATMLERGYWLNGDSPHRHRETWKADFWRGGDSPKGFGRAATETRARCEAALDAVRTEG